MPFTVVPPNTVVSKQSGIWLTASFFCQAMRLHAFVLPILRVRFPSGIFMLFVGRCEISL
jgi:hypothetical protein